MTASATAMMKDDLTESTMASANEHIINIIPSTTTQFNDHILDTCVLCCHEYSSEQFERLNTLFTCVLSNMFEELFEIGNYRRSCDIELSAKWLSGTYSSEWYYTNLTETTGINCQIRTIHGSTCFYNRLPIHDGVRHRIAALQWLQQDMPHVRKFNAWDRGVIHHSVIIVKQLGIRTKLVKMRREINRPWKFVRDHSVVWHLLNRRMKSNNVRDVKHRFWKWTMDHV